MQRLVIIVPLAEGSEERAAELVAGGPPFEPEDTSFERHGVYLSESEVVFLFEGPDAEWEVDDLMSDPLKPGVTDALEAWKPLLAGKPRLAREGYFWARSGSGADVERAGSS